MVGRGRGADLYAGLSHKIAITCNVKYFPRRNYLINPRPVLYWKGEQMTPDGKYIIAVDFDGTLITGNKWPDVEGEPNHHLISILIRERKRGNKVILWTNRTDKPEQEEYPLRTAIDFCKNAGLEFDAINENLPEIIQAYGNNSRKVSADLYIDDKALAPEVINLMLFDEFEIPLNTKSLVVNEK